MMATSTYMNLIYPFKKCGALIPYVFKKSAMLLNLHDEKAQQKGVQAFFFAKIWELGFSTCTTKKHNVFELRDFNQKAKQMGLGTSLTQS